MTTKTVRAHPHAIAAREGDVEAARAHVAEMEQRRDAQQRDLRDLQGDIDAAHMAVMDLYFESAGMILTLITLGKYFEARAKGKTTDAISSLQECS